MNTDFNEFVVGRSCRYFDFMHENGYDRSRADQIRKSLKAPPIFKVGRTLMIDVGAGTAYLAALAKGELTLNPEDFHATPATHSPEARKARAERERRNHPDHMTAAA